MTFWNSNDISFEIFDNKIILKAGLDAIKELNENKDNDDFNSDMFLYEIVEDLCVNSEYEFTADCSDFGQLSNCPCFFIPVWGEDDEVIGVENIYYFSEYQIRSVQDYLLNNGECVFNKLNEVQ